MRPAGQIHLARLVSLLNHTTIMVWRLHISAAVVPVLAYLVAVLTMGVNDEEQCNEGGAAGDDDDNNRQGDGPLLQQ